MDDLIYNQRKIPKETWRYGLRSSAAVGCGWIATYNALRLLGYRVKPEALIRYFERQLPLLHGNTGTSFWGPALYFRQWGFPVKMTVRREQYDEMVRNCECAILFYHWRKGWRFGAHFVTVRYRDGKFTGYNTFRTSDGPDDYGSSLESFMRQRKWFGTVLTCVRDKRRK